MKVNEAMGSASAPQRHADPSKEQRRLKDACKKFEGIFLAQMLKNSMKGLSSDEDKGRKGNVLCDVAMEMTGEALAEASSGVGIADMLYESLKDSVED
ncbi:hypothetical protein Tlie_0114 [Thermovirga lienii DSM 17291]|jgi:flagellar protein FlgJ|uniref:Flagellar protein FlgJ n=1 Tax=Thermovirga lienii (strain ATCC BAA-1197 / DSM 17291 / Cas60314) TaxID=580340 RepID=G7V5V5_THELD|nr:hypothetical protein [Thermovirga lienii]AER65860.1 hypothetical protein Tlie_0114 [Thermovirga lienii DSM 17291]KUK42993.1 MAG: Uncharacterized protein XD70_0189 [Thermovirga lienii]MDN5318991.1 peptidoglycan hydrolase FlgJ [Thermovirga sp.]MDN5368230.1 peptidoglycan hydrolase FlgJ [Thermovirga sp.]